MHFLPGSLASWADKLDKSDFKFLFDTDLRKKQVFPYDYFTVITQTTKDTSDNNNKNNLHQQPHVYSQHHIGITDKLIESQLPPLCYFTSEEDYEWAKYTFSSKKCLNLNDYMLMYLNVDILLLAEVFEKFVDTSLDRYHLDPSWYYTTPGYSWDCALYMTGETIELLMDNDMVEFFLSDAIRGGVSSVLFKKDLIANNEYIPNYNPLKPKVYIMYLDITNLYGYAMVQKLPHSGFEFMSEDFCKQVFENVSILWPGKFIFKKTNI